MIKLCKKLKIEVVEKKISIDEVIKYIEDGSLTESFGMGTAAVIAPIGSVFFDDKDYIINNFNIGPISKKIYKELLGIQYGEIPDPFSWIEKVE